MRKNFSDFSKNIVRTAFCGSDYIVYNEEIKNDGMHGVVCDLYIDCNENKDRGAR